MVFFRHTEWAYALTIAASSGFVLCAIAGRSWRHPYGRLMTLALILCFAGDLLGVHDFLWGGAAFFFAHLVFMAAFLRQGVDWKCAARAAIAVLLCGFLLMWWLLPHVPAAERWLVLSYMAVLCGMVALAAGVRLPRGRVLAVAAAVLFLVSDIFVARWKYVSASGVNAYFCFPQYYAACVLFALSVSARSRAA